MLILTYKSKYIQAIPPNRRFLLLYIFNESSSCAAVKSGPKNYKNFNYFKLISMYSKAKHYLYVVVHIHMKLGVMLYFSELIYDNNLADCSF